MPFQSKYKTPALQHVGPEINRKIKEVKLALEAFLSGSGGARRGTKRERKALQLQVCRRANGFGFGAQNCSCPDSANSAPWNALGHCTSLRASPAGFALGAASQFS